MTPAERAEKAYEITRNVAHLNALAQAASGIVGSGVNLVVDAAALPFYWKMWNKLRRLYGHGALTKEAAIVYLRPNISYLIQDILFDKIVGSIPLIGIPFNYVFARALTWRLGAWFALLSAMATARSGGNIPNAILTRYSLDLVRQFFPPEAFLDFSSKDPDREKFVRFIAGLEGLSDEEAERRLKKAFDALQGE